jgi:hypothetical protein
MRPGANATLTRHQRPGTKEKFAPIGKTVGVGSIRQTVLGEARDQSVPFAREATTPSVASSRPVGSGQLATHGMVGDERPARADDAGGVRYVRRDDGSVTHSEAPCVPIDDEHDRAAHDVPHLFLDMTVLVKIGGVSGDSPVGERHRVRVEEPPRPST